MMPPNEERRLSVRNPRSGAPVHSEFTPDLRDGATTSSGPTFEWAECPDHPWYGVSVMVIAESALCVPPLDGTPNHWVAIR